MFLAGAAEAPAPFLSIEKKKKKKRSKNWAARIAPRSRADRPQPGEDRVVQVAVGRQDAAVGGQRATVRKIERTTVEIGHSAARFGDHDRPGRLVPACEGRTIRYSRVAKLRVLS